MFLSRFSSRTQRFSVFAEATTHAIEDMNEIDSDNGGGFLREVVSAHGLAAHRRFVDTFKLLSFHTVIEKELFVTHGGLTRVRSMPID